MVKRKWNSVIIRIISLVLIAVTYWFIDFTNKVRRRIDFVTQEKMWNRKQTAVNLTKPKQVSNWFVYITYRRSKKREMFHDSSSRRDVLWSEKRWNIIISKQSNTRKFLHLLLSRKYSDCFRNCFYKLINVIWDNSTV